MSINGLLWVIEERHERKCPLWRAKHGLSTVHRDYAEDLLGEVHSKGKKGYEYRITPYKRVDPESSHAVRDDYLQGGFI